MNLAFALDYIPRRMRELGFGERYVVRYRQLRLADKTATTFKAYNQLMLFIEPEVLGIKVESERGVFNLGDTVLNIQQHEHSAAIRVSNDTGTTVSVLFIQVIPQHKKQKR